MQVFIANAAGFCFGVERSIQVAGTALKQASMNKKKAISLGELIHNPIVVGKLEEQGLKVVADVSEIPDNSVVVLRSHGVEKVTYDILREKNCEVFDATCPFVRKAQRIVQEETKNGKFVIIIGDYKHPEIRAMRSYAVREDMVKVLEKEQLEKEVDNLLKDRKREISIVFQTTYKVYEAEEIEKKFADEKRVTVFNTVCKATEERQENAVKLAKNVDAMIVVGGRNSANTNKLYRLCSEVCEETYFIERNEEIEQLLEKLRGKRIGITGGASTPPDQVKQIATIIEKSLGGMSR